MKSKFVRDPVHGEIEISAEFVDIVDNELFQRLRRIRQLSLAEIVYPGATHTRFLHSLGVYHISRVFGDELLSLYALLHDIGHGPFSHVFEAGVKFAGKKFDHDKNMLEVAKEILQNSSFSLSELKKAIREKGVLVHGDLGIDRQDYLIRDSYFTGVKIGYVSWERLCRLMKAKSGRIVIDSKAIEVAEHLFIARFLLGSAVYFHKTNLIAEHMFYRVIAYLLEEYSVDELKFMDDFELVRLIESSEGPAHEMWIKIKKRNLFKMIFRTRKREEALELYEKLAERFGEENVIFGERGAWQKPVNAIVEGLGELREVSPLISSLVEADERRRYYFVAVERSLAKNL